MPEPTDLSKAAIKELTGDKVFPRPIVTEVAPFAVFYPAEDYHQEYFARHPEQGYCQVVIAPKVAKFRKQFLSQLKKQGQPG